MKKLSFLVSLTNDENDYQQEQQAAAEKAARRLGVDLKIVHASNDAVTQSQQLLHYIQGRRLAARCNCVRAGGRNGISAGGSRRGGRGYWLGRAEP